MRRVFILGLVCLAALAVSTSASTAYASGLGGYKSHNWPGCGGGFNSGSWDSNGLVYVPCGNPSVIGIYDQDAHRTGQVDLDYFVSDVAPTRDGSYLYVATGSSAPRRLARQSDGSYLADDSWQPESYVMWGSSRFEARGYFVATDAAGRVYVSDGYWSPNNTHTVLVYDSFGKLITRFGEWKNSWDTGTFYWALGGIAVNDSGSVIYTAEAGNNRVQIWTRQGEYSKRNISYNASREAFGGNAGNNAAREGYCDFSAWLGKFAAPYDVALDGEGNIYVINTTCKQVLSFTPSFEALRANISVALGTGSHPRPHGFALGRDGTVYVGENQHLLRPAAGALPADGLPPQRNGGAPVSSSPVQPVASEPPIAQPSAPTSTEADLPRIPPSVTLSPADARPARPSDNAAPTARASQFRFLRNRNGLERMQIKMRCSERCLVRLTILERGRKVGARAIWLRSQRVGSFSVTLRRRQQDRTRRVIVRMIVTDEFGNARTLARALPVR